MNDRLRDALDELVPAPAEQGDWADVLARAGVRRSRPRRPLLLAAAAAVVLALVATPAFGIGSALLDLIGRTDVVFSRGSEAPNPVKKLFFDHMGAGAPAGMSPQAIASETRKVGLFRVRGHLRALWVAPTRGGGYCYLYDDAVGGCRTNRAGPVLGISWQIHSAHGKPVQVLGGEGQVTSPAVEHVRLRYRDGGTAEIPFVWVSKPIAAGFFTFTVPAGRTPAAVIALDGGDKRIATSTPAPIHQAPLRRITPTPRPPVILPGSTPAEPSAPRQTGSGDGVFVIAGRNGAVLFDLRAASRRLLGVGHRLAYTCFRITHEFGIFGLRGDGRDGALTPKVAIALRWKGPFDGCEISGFYGHIWPDRFGSHAPAEVPLTDAGRRFFADRAAARDLALFVRSRRVQALRKEPPARALRDLRAAYPALASSAIRIEPTATGLAFSETSPTGKRFTVVVSNSRIAEQNLKPYAFVF